MIPNVTRPCAFVFIRDEDRVLLARMRDPSEIDRFDGYAIPEAAAAGGDRRRWSSRSTTSPDVVLYPDGVLPLITGPRSTHAAAAAVIREGRILLVRRRDDRT